MHSPARDARAGRMLGEQLGRARKLAVGVAAEDGRHARRHGRELAERGLHLVVERGQRLHGKPHHAVGGVGRAEAVDVHHRVAAAPERLEELLHREHAVPVAHALPVAAALLEHLGELGHDVERIFEVDLATQASDRRVEEATLVGASTEVLLGDEGKLPLADLLPEGTACIVAELAEVLEQGRGYWERVSDGHGVLSVQELFKALGRRCHAVVDV
ncbi:MAG: hypothetical protein ACKORL_12200, partial [Phycisphaerales bacterium]